MMAGKPNWWSVYVHPPSYHQLPPPPPSTLVSSSSTSPYFFHPQFVVGSSSPANPPHNLLPFSDNGTVYQEQLPRSWKNVATPTSCVTILSGGGNTWDFSKTTRERGKNRISHHSSECNSTATGGSCKKARVHPPSSQPPLKVRKEKLGDRISSLHELVSPFGKTDTASVLLEAIGYIRFLQGQIEALSSPYLRNNNESGNVGSHHHSVLGEANYAFSGDAVAQDNHDKPKDLRSRGLCLVPVFCTSQVGKENGADYWAAPAFGGGF